MSITSDNSKTQDPRPEQRGSDAGATLSPAESAPTRRVGFSVARWVLRVVATIQAVLLISQPILIGQYLDGRYAMIKMHSDVAAGLTVMAFLFMLLTVWFSLAGGRWWVLPFGPVFGFAVIVQAGVGYASQLGIHIPLGVAVVVVGVGFAIWCWMPRSGRVRPSRRQRRIAKDAARLAQVADQLQSGADSQVAGGDR